MNTFNSILVDIDASARAQVAVRRAADLARACGARLRIVDVMSPEGHSGLALLAGRDDASVRWRREQLRRVAANVRDVAVDVDVLVGSPAAALIADVTRFDHDLVVRDHRRDLASRGRQGDPDVAVQLFRRCPCPVWAIGPGWQPEHTQIAAAIDLAIDNPARHDLNAQVLDVALRYRQLNGARISVVHAWEPPGDKQIAGQASVAEYLRHLDRSRGRVENELAVLLAPFAERLVGAQVTFRRGRIDDVLPTFVVAEGIDMVVIGSAGRTGIARHIFGNTAERLLRRLPCSVVAVKAMPQPAVKHARTG